MEKKPEARSQKPGVQSAAGDAIALGRISRASARRRLFALLLATGYWLLASSPASARPTQEDVFRSIKENVGESKTDYSKLLPYLVAGAGFVVLLALLSQRRREETAPKALNHQGKLLKEVLKSVPLRAAEVKQLRILAEEVRDEPLESPLTLLLCPSLLAEAIQSRQASGNKGKGKLDRQAVLDVARKAGLVTGKKQK